MHSASMVQMAARPKSSFCRLRKALPGCAAARWASAAAMRARSCAAAARVKVTARMRSAGMGEGPSHKSDTTRCVSTAVLPLPAAALTPAFGSNTSLGALAQASSVPSSWRHTGR